MEDSLLLVTGDTIVTGAGLARIVIWTTMIGRDRGR